MFEFQVRWWRPFNVFDNVYGWNSDRVDVWNDDNGWIDNKTWSGLLLTFYTFYVTIILVTDLDLQSEIIIFESFLTTFELSVIFEAAGAVVKIGSSLRLNHRNQI